MWQSDYGSDNTDKLCHEGITQNGFLVYVAARNLLFGGGEIGFTLSDMVSLSKEVGWPDYDLTRNDYGLFIGHFHDPDTGENYVHQTNNTAKTRAENYYNLAVSSYRKGGAGNRIDALAYLAYCLHYAQDLGVPHHASNKTAVHSNHSKFEKDATSVLYNEFSENVNLEDFEYDIDFYNSYLLQSMGSSVHNIAVESKKPLAAADSDTEALRRFTAYFLLGNSMMNTSGILYKFAKDVGMI